MNADGSVDYASFKAILKEQEQAKNGITILGSTGEGLNLDDDEKKAILDFALGLKLQVPLMASVGGVNLHSQTAWIEHLNTLDIDCLPLGRAPLYAKPGIHGQYGWFKALMDTAQKPCMLYNIPGRTAKKLEQLKPSKCSKTTPACGPSRKPVPPKLSLAITRMSHQVSA